MLIYALIARLKFEITDVPGALTRYTLGLQNLSVEFRGGARHCLYRRPRVRVVAGEVTTFMTPSPLEGFVTQSKA